MMGDVGAVPAVAKSPSIADGEVSRRPKTAFPRRSGINADVCAIQLVAEYGMICELVRDRPSFASGRTVLSVPPPR
jgi:hypothetical protein